LARFPQSGRRGRIEGTRELVISRTPDVVAHRITCETVRILRVLHGARRGRRICPKKRKGEAESATQSLEVRIRKQLQATGSSSVEEASPMKRIDILTTSRARPDRLCLMGPWKGTL
jgi:hypothetical protein